MIEPKSVTREIAGRPLTIETGRLAKQTSGSVVVRYGDTVVLVTAVISVDAREGVDFLPLTVDYEERMYGRIEWNNGFIMEGAEFWVPGPKTSYAKQLARVSKKPFFRRQEIGTFSSINFQRAGYIISEKIKGEAKLKYYLTPKGKRFNVTFITTHFCIILFFLIITEWM